jgi:hypothetical protein
MNHLTQHKRKWIHAGIAMLLSVIVAFGIFESFLSVEPLLTTTGKITKKRVEAVLQFRELGLHTMPVFLPRPIPQFLVDGENIYPLSGAPNTLTLLCNEAGTWEWFASDQYGFSNPKNAWQHRQIDVVLLGDSFVLGECLSTEKRFPSIVQSAIPRTLNLGYSYSSTLTELGRYVEFAHKYRPKTVFIFYYEENDPIELVEEAKLASLAGYIESPTHKQDLIGKMSKISAMFPIWMEAVRKQKYQTNVPPTTSSVSVFPRTQKLIQSTLETQTVRTVDKNRFLEVFERSLSRFEKFTASSGTKNVLVYLPSHSKTHRELKGEVEHLARKHRFDYIDMDIEFARNGIDPFTPYAPYHYNEAGHALLAEIVKKRASLRIP